MLSKTPHPERGMRSWRIGKMPHHLRRVTRGSSTVFQYQRAVPKPLQEIVAKITGHKTLTDKERENGHTVPFVAWFIRGTGTGNEAAAKRMVQEKFDPEFQRVITRAKLWIDAPAIAAAIIEGRMDDVSMEQIGCLGMPAAAAVLKLYDEHFQRLDQRATDINTLVSKFRAVLCGIPLNDNLPAETAIFRSPEPRKQVESAAVLKAWIAERAAEGNAPKDKAIENKRSKLARLFAFIAGIDLPDRLTKEQIETLLVAGNLAAITRDDLKRYRLWLLDKGGTVAFDHLANVKALFAVAKRGGLIDINPADEDIVLPKKADNPRPPFNDAEAKTILIAARYAAPVVRWSHWLAAFTATINSEILEAQASEVYQIEDGHPFAGQWVFDMRSRKLKTGFRPRIVPLHPALIREGFLDYVATRAGKPLFDGNTDGNTNKLNDFLDDLGITKTFYSWRHRTTHLIDKLTSPSLSRFIAGHAAKDIHEKFYLHHDLPEEFGEIVTAINGLVDPSL